MKQVLSRVFKIISSAIFIVLMIIMAIIIVYIVRVNFLAGNDKLGDVRVNMYTILTQSMYPTIKAGDIIVTYKEDNNKYNVGDVITFTSERSGGMTITHRVEEAFSVNNEYSYKTKGDNNNTADGEVIKGSNVLGRVLFKIPKAGYVQQFLVTKTGWLVAVILPAAGIIIYDILNLVLVALGVKEKKPKKYTNKKDEARIKEARKKLKEVTGDEK